jgi:lycopene cyclase domain-containing protein
MEPRYLYLLLDLATLSIPLAFSFYPKANFSKKWRSVIPALIITALIFIAWDELFTRWNVWGFNPVYTTGVYAGSLPLEEVLFFICIPYACLFTHEAIFYFFGERDPLRTAEKWITPVLITLLLGTGLTFIDRAYTSVTFLSLSVLIGGVRLLSRKHPLSRFYFSFLFILIPFFLVNGILTGSWIDGEVVWYNNEENLGLRVGTIPVEDAFYGMLLILLNLVLSGLIENLTSRSAGITRNAMRLPGSFLPPSEPGTKP